MSGGTRGGGDDDGDPGSGDMYGGIVEFSDLGALVTAGDGCVSVDSQHARCTADPGLVASVRGTLDGAGEIVTGDLDDRIRVLASCCGWSTDAGAGDDRVEGGSVTYARRRDAVSVDLRAARGGAPGERDALIGIGRVTGGAGDDRLYGSAVRDTLEGGPGDDRIAGRGAGDQLWGLSGGAGHDRLAGGPGDDAIRR